MTGEEGTEGKVNDEKSAEFAKNLMFLLTHLPRSDPEFFLTSPNKSSILIYL